MDSVKVARSATGPPLCLLVGGGVLVATLAVSWWEILFLALGDSHDGRIHGRFGLQIRNIFDEGLAGSNLGASMEPFSDQAYAHHPPLLNGIHALIGWLFGQGELQLHLIGYLAGLLTVVALLWLSRELGFGPVASLGAVALIVGTPMFWIYARLGLGISLGLLFLATWSRSRRLPGGRSDRWVVVLAAVTALSSWTGAALVLVVVAWEWRDVARRPIVVKVLTATLISLAVVVVWVLSASSVKELADHTASRVSSPVGFGEFVDQYRWFYRTLFPAWFRWLMPGALALSLLSRTTRVAGGSLLAVSIVWTVALPEAAYVHDYWTYPLLGSVGLGLVVGLQWTLDRGVNRSVAAAALVVLAVASLISLEQSSIRDDYFRQPAMAGELVRSVAPADSQTTAWVVGPINVPRWLSYYWDLPVRELHRIDLAQPGEHELVLMRLDRLPEWLNSQPPLTARAGRYGLVSAGDLRRQVASNGG